MCPFSGEICEFESYCSQIKEDTAPGTQLAIDREALIAIAPHQASLIEKTYGYCSEDKLNALLEALADPTTPTSTKDYASVIIDSVTRSREPHRQN